MLTIVAHLSLLLTQKNCKYTENIEEMKKEASVNPNTATSGSLSFSTCSFAKIGQGALRVLFAILMLIGSFPGYWPITTSFRFFMAGWVSFFISVFLEYYNGLNGYDDKRKRFYIFHLFAALAFVGGSEAFISTKFRNNDALISYAGFWIGGGILNAVLHGLNGFHFCKDNIVLKISHILGVIGSLAFAILGILELLKAYNAWDIVLIVGSSIYILHSVFYCWGVISAKEPITQDEEVEDAFNGVWPSQPSNDGGSIAQKLEELASIKHILTESEFEAKKREILASV